MELINLPVELLTAIWAHLEQLRDKNALVRTCQYLYSVLNEKFYRQLARHEFEGVLRWATTTGPLTTMQKFIDAGVDPSGNNDYSPLCGAAYVARIEMVQFLLGLGVKPGKAKSGMEPIASAVRGGDIEILRILLTARREMASAAEFAGLTASAMEGAINRDRCDMVKVLIEGGADINAKGLVDGMAPLARAVYWNTPAIVEYLLDAGAAVEEGMVLPDELDPLYYTAAQGYTELARLLLQRNIAGRNVEALAMAAGSGHGDMVRVLLDAGADPSTPGFNGETPVYRAAERGDAEIVATLLEAGASAESMNGALTRAVHNHHDGVVAVLLQNGARDSKNQHGHSALFWATRRGRPGAARLLFDAGAHLETGMELDPMLVGAASVGNSEIVALLLERGANPRFQDAKGYTPLSRAVLDGHTEVVELLLDFTGREKGPDDELGTAPEGDLQYIDTPDVYGRTPLFHATIHGHVDIVQILVKRGSTATNTAAHSGLTPVSFADTHRGRSFGDIRDGILQIIWEYLCDPTRGSPPLPNLRDEYIFCYNCDLCAAPPSPFEDYVVCTGCRSPLRFDFCGDCISRGASCTDPSHPRVVTAV